jgi:hypothetical protein
MSPFSGSKNKLNKKPAVKMEATYSSETSIDFQRITRFYIPQDRTLHSSICLEGMLPRKGQCLMSLVFLPFIKY